MTKDLIKLADSLDKLGLYKEADRISGIISIGKNINKFALSDVAMAANELNAAIQLFLKGGGGRSSQALLSRIEFEAARNSPALSQALSKLSPAQVSQLSSKIPSIATFMRNTSLVPAAARSATTALTRGITGPVAASASKLPQSLMGASGVGASTSAAGGASAGSIAGPVILAGLAGLAIGTAINYGLKRSGVNDAVIDWLLQPNLKNGIKYTVSIDASSDPSVLNNAIGFIPTGVSGVLMKGSSIVNKNSSSSFPQVSTVGIKQPAIVMLPQNQNGLLVPSQVVGQIIYSDGRRRNAISSTESIEFIGGTNEVKAKLNRFSKNFSG